MTCSAARLAANRTNAAKSSGPKTPEGKEVSRRNALRHGLTGQGVVVPGEDAAEVDRRFARLASELAGDGSAATMLLAERVAVLSVRLERSTRHDFATTAERVRQADAEFLADRQAEAARLFDALAADPSHREDLLAFPAGVDLILDHLDGLRGVATTLGASGWTEAAGHTLARCLGLRADALGATGSGNLDAILKRIDAEIHRLEAHQATLDHAAVEQARAAARDCALVGDDPSTLLARKYEAATERSLFRTLKEVRESKQGQSTPAPSSEPAGIAQSLAAAQAQLARLAEEPRPVPPADPVPPMGSFFPGATPVAAARPTVPHPSPRSQSRYADRKQRPRLKC